MNACRLDFPVPAVDRKFWRILLLSALVHGGLFLLMAWEREQGARQLPALLATIRMALPEPAAVTGTPVAVTSDEPASARPPRSLRHETSPRLQPNPRPVPTASPVAMPEAPSTTVSPAGSTVAPAALPATAAAASTIQPVAQTIAPAPSAAVDGAAEALTRYRQRLTALLARQQEYPRVAAMRGWEGEVRLRLRVARKGQLLAVALDRSSGHAVLDEHAAAMLAELGNLPPLPDSVEGSEIQVVVPVNYRLNRNT